MGSNIPRVRWLATSVCLGLLLGPLVALGQEETEDAKPAKAKPAKKTKASVRRARTKEDPDPPDKKEGTSPSDKPAKKADDPSADEPADGSKKSTKKGKGGPKEEGDEGFGAARRKKSAERGGPVESSPERARLARQINAKLGRKDNAIFVIQTWQRERVTEPDPPDKAAGIVQGGVRETTDFVVREGRRETTDYLVDYLSEFSPTKAAARPARSSRARNASPAPAGPDRGWQLLQTFPAGDAGMDKARAYCKAAKERYEGQRQWAEQQQKALNTRGGGS